MTSEESPLQDPRPRRPRSLRGFYARAISEAERTIMERAAEMQGLDEEIALLRTKLSQALAERPEDTELLFKGINLLVRAVSARYRLSGDAKRDLFDNLVGALKGIGEQLFPERMDDGDAA